MNPSATMTPPVDLLDLEPASEDILREALAGMRREPREFPSKLLYDPRGAELFDAICELPEYYPTRTEIGILRAHGPAMAEAIGPEALVIEFGSGAGVKPRLLLDHLRDPCAYVPLDIARGHLLRSARQLARAYPETAILPVCADYTQALRLPEPPSDPRKRLAFFPGSTIGNFPRREARAFLRRIARIVGTGGLLLIGVDLRKDPDILRPAYNDAAGVTAAFNRNLLERLNREVGATFQVEAFEHDAIWNEAESRIEMWLHCRADHVVAIGRERFQLRAGESIRTEYSHKYGLEDFAALADPFFVRECWLDEKKWFSVQLLEVIG